MILVLVVLVRNTNSAVAETHKRIWASEKVPISFIKLLSKNKQE